MSTRRPIRCVLIGAGGHARSVLEALASRRDVRLIGVLSPKRASSTFEGLPILGGDDVLPALRRDGATHFAMGVGGIGDNQPRRLAHERALRAGLKPLSVIHPSAVAAATAAIGPGSILLARAVLGPGSRIGENVIINTAAVVEHDCEIASHAHIATGALLCGGTRIGASAHVGAGAVVLQGLSLGRNSLIGAGAVVTRDIPAGRLAVGVPARTTRRKNS